MSSVAHLMDPIDFAACVLRVLGSGQSDTIPVERRVAATKAHAKQAVRVHRAQHATTDERRRAALDHAGAEVYAYLQQCGRLGITITAEQAQTIALIAVDSYGDGMARADQKDGQ